MRRFSIRYSLAVVVCAVMVVPSYSYATTLDEFGISANWSGYQSAATDVSGVEGAWRVVPITGTTRDASYAVWIGLGGIREADVLQIGSHAIKTTSSVRYTLWYELYPAAPKIIPISVRVGDTVYAKISRRERGFWLLELHNKTTKKHFRVVVSYPHVFTTAAWILERPHRLNKSFVPFAQIPTVSMTMVGVWNDGKRTNLFESSAQPITMVDVDAKYVQAYVAATDEQGNGFSIKRGSQSMPWIVPTGYTIHE